MDFVPFDVLVCNTLHASGSRKIPFLRLEDPWSTLYRYVGRSTCWTVDVLAFDHLSLRNCTSIKWWSMSCPRPIGRSICLAFDHALDDQMVVDQLSHIHVLHVHCRLHSIGPCSAALHCADLRAYVQGQVVYAWSPRTESTVASRELVDRVTVTVLLPDLHTASYHTHRSSICACRQTTLSLWLFQVTSSSS